MKTTLKTRKAVAERLVSDLVALVIAVEDGDAVGADMAVEQAKYDMLRHYGMLGDIGESIEELIEREQ